MAHESEAHDGYVIPRYRDEGEPAWYHVLHGTVPGHQIDFIYCPEVPQGALTQTHFAHISRLIKYIEPRDKASFAFAIGNLSRDDVQHDPGHGGIALMFGLRVEGVVDHANRAMPPYAHALLSVDRALDQRALVEAIATFQERFLGEGPQDATGGFYRHYVKLKREQSPAVLDFLRDYVSDFNDLPQPGRSKFGLEFIAPEDVRFERLTIVHSDREKFRNIARVAATIGSVLYRSNIKWTTISNGGDFDIPGGISIRLVPEGELPRSPKGRVLPINEVPTDEGELAEKLFTATRPHAGAARRVGWREQYAAKSGGTAHAEAPRRFQSSPPGVLDPPSAMPAAPVGVRGKRTLPPGNMVSPLGAPPPSPPSALTESSSRLPRAVVPAGAPTSLTESSSRLPRAAVPAGAAPSLTESSSRLPRAVLPSANPVPSADPPPNPYAMRAPAPAPSTLTESSSRLPRAVLPPSPADSPIGNPPPEKRPLTGPSPTSLADFAAQMASSLAKSAEVSPEPDISAVEVELDLDEPTSVDAPVDLILADEEPAPAVAHNVRQMLPRVDLTAQSAKNVVDDSAVTVTATLEEAEVPSEPVVDDAAVTLAASMQPASTPPPAPEVPIPLTQVRERVPDAVPSAPAIPPPSRHLPEVSPFPTQPNSPPKAAPETPPVVAHQRSPEVDFADLTTAESIPIKSNKTLWIILVSVGFSAAALIAVLTSEPSVESGAHSSGPTVSVANTTTQTLSPTTRSSGVAIASSTSKTDTGAATSGDPTNTGAASSSGPTRTNGPITSPAASTPPATTPPPSTKPPPTFTPPATSPPATTPTVTKTTPPTQPSTKPLSTSGPILDKPL